MSQKEFTGKTIEYAILAGLGELNIEREQAEITIIEQPTSGFLRSKKAKVAIGVKKSDGERASLFLDGLLEKMNIVATSELVETQEKIAINLIATSSSSLIGYRGEVLDALQTLAGAIANIGREDYKRVVVDCENYREKREETLVALANRLADKAVAKAKKYSLEPMNPYERRIIHSSLSSRTDIKTVSDGREPNRFISIIPNNAKFSYDKKPRRPYGDKSRTSERKPFTRDDSKTDYNNKKDSNFKNRSRSNFADKRESTVLSSSQKPAKKLGFGTYLGNSLKD